MFKGSHQHSMDAKGRTSLPARFRELLTERSEEHLVVTQGPAKSLWCLPPSTWEGIERSVRDLPQFDQDVLDFMHAFIVPAQECPFDKMGRILVPPTLREYAGLEGEVFWLGAMNRIELWSGERWRKRQGEATSSVLDSGRFPAKLSEKLGTVKF